MMCVRLITGFLLIYAGITCIWDRGRNFVYTCFLIFGLVVFLKGANNFPARFTRAVHAMKEND